MKLQIAKKDAIQIIKEEFEKNLKLKVLKEQKQLLENELKEFEEPVKECPCGDKMPAEQPKNLRETGEWDDNDEGLSLWKEALQNTVEKIEKGSGGKLVLNDVKGFDKYQGPYAEVTIDGKNYNIWTVGEADGLWIEEFPVDNTSQQGMRSGFEGDADDIIDMLIGVGAGVDEGIGIGKSLTVKKSIPRRLQEPGAAREKV